MIIVPFEEKLLDGAYEAQCDSDESWSKEMLAQELKNPCAIGFCAVDAEEVAGYISLHVICDEATINSVTTALNHRRKGIASKLLTHSVNELSKRKVNSIFLEVRSKNIAAIALYSAFEFERCGMRKGFYSDPDDDALLYVKKINTAEQ